MSNNEEKNEKEIESDQESIQALEEIFVTFNSKLDELEARKAELLSPDQSQ